MAGTPVFVYTTDPGLEVLLGKGPVINVVRDLQQAIRFAGGRAIMGVVGSPVDDNGRVNEAFRAPLGPEEITSTFGGFLAYMGDGLANADRGAASGYNGNLAAQTQDMIAPVWVFCFPDLAIKDASISPGPATNILIEITRTGTDDFVLPAGTRVREAGAGARYTLATLEKVVFAPGELIKTVRVRQVSEPVADGGPAPVAINLVDTFVDTLFVTVQGLTLTQVAVTVPDEIDLAEVDLRYGAALDLMSATLFGASVTVVVTDRTDILITDRVSVHATAETGIGHFRVGVVSPPIGTSAAVAAGAAGDGIGRATLDRTRTAYAHPGWRRSFVEDSDNLIGPLFLASNPTAMLAACKIALELPEQNPAIPHEIFARVGFNGVEPLAPAPVPSVQWEAGIMQIIVDNDELGNQIGSFFAGIVASGAEIADVRFDDFIVRGSIVRAKPSHKRVATEENQADLITAITGFLESLFKAGRIFAYGLSLTYDGANQHADIHLAVQTPGNMNVITLRTEIGPAVTVKAA